MRIRRPVLRYHGGKWKLSPWIISHLPAHRIYVESYGGAASVLLSKERAYAEVYNDLDGEIVNLFRVLRDPAQARELVRLLRLTPYARAEFEASYLVAGDPIEQARRTITRSFMGFSSSLTGKWTTGFRSNTKRSGTTPAHDWRNYPEALEAIIERLRGVVIENRPAVDVMRTHDSAETLHYVDPPYVIETRRGRWAGNAYRYEMSDDDHSELICVLNELQGIVVLSGYPNNLYDNLLLCSPMPWQRVQRRAYADGASERIEVLWLSPRTVEALKREKNDPIQQSLFSDSLSGGQMAGADVSPAGETIGPLTLSRPASLVPLVSPLVGSVGPEPASSSLEMGGGE